MSRTLSGRHDYEVAAKTAAYTVLANDNGTIFTNTAAAGAVTLSLPAAVVGLRYGAHVKAAQELRLDPNGTETIALPTGVQQAAGKYISADAIGEYIRILCVKAGEWDVEASVGTWTAES